MFRAKYVMGLRDQVVLLQQQGFTQPQIKSFLWHRKLYCTGCYQSGYDSSEHDRLIFARWLYQQGKIEG